MTGLTHQTRPRLGFSLLELLVVIMIIVVLAAIIMPVARSVRQAVLGTKCAGNQLNTAMAIFLYANDRRGMLPYAFDSRTSRFYDVFLEEYIPRAANYGQHQAYGRMYDCPAIRYDYNSPGYKTKGPDYGPNSYIMPRYSPGVSEGHTASITRASEVVLIGDASPGMCMGLSAGSYYMFVNRYWVDERGRIPWTSYPCARHPMPNDLSDPMDGKSVGGQYFIGVMADLRVAKIMVNDWEFASPEGRARTFTQP